MRKKSWAYKGPWELRWELCWSEPHLTAAPWGTRGHAGRAVPSTPTWGDPGKEESEESALAFPLHLLRGMRERNALVGLSHPRAGPCGWLRFVDMQDMSPPHWRGVGGPCMPRSTTTTTSQPAGGKRPALEPLIRHSGRLTGSIVVLGSVAPMAAGCQKLSYLSPSLI